MSFRTVTPRDRLVRRAVLALATAGITALGVVTLPLVASAEPAAPVPSAAARHGEHDTAFRSPRPARADSGVATPGATAAPGLTAQGAAITPGVEMITPLPGGSASCTGNFIYTSGGSTYLGYAAHCASVELATSLNGCQNRTTPLGTRVTIKGLDGRDYTGTLAYNSWRAMQAVGEDNQDECFYNDLGLVEISPGDVDQVDPSVPVFGGPEGLDTDGVAVGERVFSYQNNKEQDGFPVMRAKNGVNRENLGGGRRHNVATTTPGFPGDSGSGYLDENGNAFGVLSTLFSAQGETRNGVSDLAMALRYAVANTDFDTITVRSGTVPFSVSDVDSAPASSGAPGLPAPRTR